MQAKVDLDIKHAFVMRADQINRIWAFLQGAIGPVRATASCADHIERAFTSPNELNAYENARARAIRGLLFTAWIADHDRSAYLNLRGDSFRSVSLKIEGPEIIVSRLRDDLLELFDGMKPWYSRITRLDFFYVVMGVLAFMMIVVAGMAGGTKSERSLSFVQAVRVAAELVGVLAGLAGLVWLLNRLRERFFPVAAFAIGQGLDRFQFDEKIRWVVIVGFVVSVFASLVAAFLYPAT